VFFIAYRTLSLRPRPRWIEFEDRYKKYRLWQDPARVLAETTPCQRANRVDPARARERIERTFGRYTSPPAAGNSPAA
jgi:hypothetical protein